MMRKMLLGIGLATALGIMTEGCGGQTPSNGTPSAKPTTAATPTATLEKGGKAFRAEWSWSSTAPGSAQVVLTVTPTMAARSLDIRATLPDGVSLLTGEVSRSLASPSANVPERMEFQIGFGEGVVPVVPVEILLVVKDEQQSAATILTHDPLLPLPKPKETPGTKTNIGGFPAKVVGEAEPASSKDKK